MEQTFKIGDCVRLTREQNGHSDAPPVGSVGWVHKVIGPGEDDHSGGPNTSVSEDENEYIVRWVTGSQSPEYYWAYELEIVENGDD